MNTKFIKFDAGEIKVCFGSGPKFRHQYNGVACSQIVVENPQTLGYSNNHLFDPKWWYSLTHRDDVGGRFVVPGFVFNLSLRDATDTNLSDFIALWDDDEVRLMSHKDKVYLNDLAPKFVDLLNKLNPDYTGFSIDGDVCEALLHVKFCVMGAKHGGVVIWENCD